jgi:hypothetical protein
LELSFQDTARSFQVNLSDEEKLSKSPELRPKSALVPYASLINNKIAIISATTPYFAVEQHFFYDLMENYLSYIYVDPQWYLEKYPDIREAIAAGAVSDSAEHFRRFGYYEHRMPYKLEVVEDWYLDAYPDVKSGIELGHFASGQAHFDMLGYREGRIPFAGFALRLVEG